LPPFHWTTDQSIIRVMEDTILRALSPELAPGGDLLVTDIRSHLPGEASHHTNPINHAEALWDDRLVAQVLPILSTLH